MSDFRPDSFEPSNHPERVDLPLATSPSILDRKGSTPRESDRIMDSIEDLCRELNELVRQACQYPPKHLKRRHIINQIVGKIEQSRKLYVKRNGDNRDYYEDALQQTWLYFSHNLCEKYDPDREGSCLIPWLLGYLGKRLADGAIGDCTRTTDPKTGNRIRRKIYYAPPVADAEGNAIDPLEFLPAQSDPQPLLDRTLEWVENDPSGILQQIAMRDRKHITAQVVLKLLLPPECLNQTEIANRLQLPQPSSIQTLYKKSLRLLLEYWELDESRIQKVLQRKKQTKKQTGGESK